MDAAVIEYIIETLRHECAGMQICSKDFLFGKKGVGLRNQNVIQNGMKLNRSYLSFLLREAMSDANREKFFPSVYDLGSFQVVPDQECTYKKLADHLYGHGVKKSEDLFQTIKSRVPEITGKSMEEHRRIDASKAIKVVKLLDEFSRTKDERMLQWLSPLGSKKPSLSLRSAFPYAKNADQVGIISDLKDRLTVELSDDRLLPIIQTFASLYDNVEELNIETERVVLSKYKGQSAVDIAGHYSKLQELCREYQVPYVTKDRPLDETLLVCISVQEFRQFALIYAEANDAAIPQVQITPVIRELRSFASQVCGELNIPVSETELIIPWDYLPVIFQNWRSSICQIMSTAFGEGFDDQLYKVILMDAYHLLESFQYFGAVGEEDLDRKTSFTSIWNIVAAFCCVWHIQRNPIIFKPFWPGQKAQGGSLRRSIQPLHVPLLDQVDQIPEEHRMILSRCTEWFWQALRGAERFCEAQFSFRSTLLIKTLEICELNDIDSIREQLDLFADFWKKRLNQVADSVLSTP